MYGKLISILGSTRLAYAVFICESVCLGLPTSDRIKLQESGYNMFILYPAFCTVDEAVESVMCLCD